MNQPAALAFLILVSACRHSAVGVDDLQSVRWLESRSMLRQAGDLARAYSGNGRTWRRPYARPQPRAASALASVWFTAYPAATITPPGHSVLATLGDPRLWAAFREIGIKGMHTGPMKRSGGIRDRLYTPTVDGNFDRISTEIDPAFGTEAEYVRLTANARASDAVIIGDIIPGHTGKGPDFRLAERAYKDYPGIYHMVEIDREDWALLPPVPNGRDSINLPPRVVDQLKARGYIVGQLPRVIFYQPGVKETDFSASAVVRGVDGKERRWVYLHYFKDGQPTLNWLDPSFAAQRMVLGDALHSLGKLGESMLRLDANGFLGIEINAPGPAWSEGHPLSVTSNQIISGMVRKLGGFTFQELNLTLDDIREMSQGGADLSYDFVTRPAYYHALVTGDAEFLRLMLGLMREYRIDPAGLIHALQNHDELTLELVHFWTKHKDERFRLRGREMSGAELRDLVRGEMHERLIGPAAPYNLKASNGISCTTASVVAAALGVRDLSAIDHAQKREILKGHLLLAMYNALQPGVFALSGWDLVGALPLDRHSVEALLADGDTRWINRGAYDLLGTSPGDSASAILPRAPALYGPLQDQLRDPASFASQLKKILAIRQRYRIHESEQLDVPRVESKGLLVMVHRLPANRGIEVTALNFGRKPVDETVPIRSLGSGAVVNLMSGLPAGAVSTGGTLRIQLAPWEGKALLVR